MPARIAQRGDEQVGADFVATDLDQALTKIDLQSSAAPSLHTKRGRLRNGVGHN
jgi:hypothetical protein